MQRCSSTLALWTEEAALWCAKAATEVHACLKSSSTRVGSALGTMSSDEDPESAGVMSWLQMSAIEAAFTKLSVPMKVPSVLMPPLHW